MHFLKESSKIYAKDIITKKTIKSGFKLSVLPCSDISYILKLFYQEKTEYIAVYSRGKILGYITKETLKTYGYIN